MHNYQGWLNVYKPKGPSSFFVIKQLKKKFNIDKIGHAGTLDPLAEGILPIAIGKATKLVSFINQNIKEYEFEIKWGQQTITDDKEGKIIASSNKIPVLKDILFTLKNFKGEILQKPPKASAVKVDGKRAYKLLRQGKDFVLKAKKVYLYESFILDSSNPLISKVKIKCGKGFYIRSFVRDLADKLNTKAHVYSLKRTKVGKFEVSNANLLDDLLKIRQTLSEFKGFHKSFSMLDDILAYELDDEKDKFFLSQGKSINIRINKFEKSLLNSIDRKIVFLTSEGNIISFGKLDGDLFKPNKVLI